MRMGGEGERGQGSGGEHLIRSSSGHLPSPHTGSIDFSWEFGRGFWLEDQEEACCENGVFRRQLPPPLLLSCFLTSKRLLKYNTQRLTTALPELGALIPQRVTAALLWPSLLARGGLCSTWYCGALSPGAGAQDPGT